MGSHPSLTLLAFISSTSIRNRPGKGTVSETHIGTIVRKEVIDLGRRRLSHSEAIVAHDRPIYGSRNLQSLNLLELYPPPGILPIMPRLGTAKTRRKPTKKVANKAKDAATSIKSTKSTKSAKSAKQAQSSSAGVEADPEAGATANAVTALEAEAAAEPEPEPEPEPVPLVDLHDKLVVLDLVRGWEIGQSLKQTSLPGRPQYHHYNYSQFSAEAAQQMLNDAKPMDLSDAIKLWSTLLNNSCLDWDGRRGIKKDYKRWTFKHFVRNRTGPAVLTVDARGSEHQQRIASVQRRLQRLDVSANHQWYIRSHGRVAECYFIHNEEPNDQDIQHELWYSNVVEFSDESKRVRQVYGPRVVDISNDNGKTLLDFVFGDVRQGRMSGSAKSGPRHWSTYCASLVEHSSFEVVLQEKKPSKYYLQKQADKAAQAQAYEEQLAIYRKEQQDKQDQETKDKLALEQAASNATAKAMLESIVTGKKSARLAKNQVSPSADDDLDFEADLDDEGEGDE